MAHAVVTLNFNTFLEKAKLKDDGSNYANWARNLRIILIAAQKNYVLEAWYVSNVSIIFDCSMLLYYLSWMFYMQLYAISYDFLD